MLAKGDCPGVGSADGLGQVREAYGTLGISAGSVAVGSVSRCAEGDSGIP